MSGALAIRADGGSGVGAGHVMRCLALADAWHASGGRVVWFSTPLPSMLADLLAARGIERHEMAASSADDASLLNWVRRHPGHWVVVDGYALGDLPERLRASGARVAIVDDTAGWPDYDCDLLVNQNPGAHELPYRTTARTRLLGPAFALLRGEFLATPPPNRTFDQPVKRVLVSFGGHDARSQAQRIAGLLRGSDVDIDVVAGVVAPDGPSAAKRLRRYRTTNLAPLMRTADLAVVAAGSVCWELAYMGLPALTLIVADNQEPVARGLDALGVVRNIGWYDRIDDGALSDALQAMLNDDGRAAMSRRGRDLIDGRGASRVLQAMAAIDSPTGTGWAQA